MGFVGRTGEVWCKSIVSTVVFFGFVLCLPIGACCLERSLSGFVMRRFEHMIL